MDLHLLADPDVLVANFDTGSLSRARLGLVRQVQDVEVLEKDAESLVARARVQGSAVVPYEVELEAEFTRGLRFVDVLTTCTCPVGRQCKHGVALALALAHPYAMAPQRPRVTWRTELEQVLAGLADAAGPDTDPVPTALRFSVGLGGPGGSTGRPTVRLRPMQRGRRGWVKRGFDWKDIPAAGLRRGHDPAQIQALLALHHGLGAQYWYAGVDRSLGEFGPHVVRLLREARDAGVVLYGDGPLTEVRLLDEPATVEVDLRAVDDGTRIGLALTVDGEPRPNDAVALAGSPVHTVAAVDGTVLLVAALTTPLTEHVASTLGRRGLVVPTGEAEALPDYLRRLGRLLPVTSTDASVDVPAPVAPRLTVTVRWSTAASAEVAWSWVYAAGAARHEAAVGGTDDLGGLRDRRAEQAVLARLDGLVPEDRTVTGADVVSLALLELPDWEARDDVDVVQLDRPDLRPAEEAPEISFDLVEPEGGRVASTGSVEEHTDWLDLEVVVVVEGEAVPLPQLLAALSAGHDVMVLPSGLIVRIDVPELADLAETVRAAAALRDRRTDEDPSRLRVARDDVGTLAALADVGRVDARASEWVERARGLRDLVDIERPEPVGVVTELRSYQREGFAWLAFLWRHRLGGVLADDMGLGKTLQVLTLVAHARDRGETAPFLVLTPTSVVGAWASEAARHTPGLRVATITATQAKRGVPVADLAAEADVVVTSYTLLRLEQEQYAAVAWAGVVMDEAQQLKNHKSLAHKAVRRLRAPFLLAVTGTPFENRLRELWSLLALVAPGLYPTLAGFSRSVAQPVEREGDQVALRRFQRRVRPFMLRRTKQLVAADLPAKQEQRLAVTLSPAHRELYDAHHAREQQRILGLLADFDENQVAVLAALTRLRQLALDPGLVHPDHDGIGSAKLDLLVEHVTEVAAEGHRVLVFSSFTGFLGRARERLAEAGIPHAYLDGSTTDRAEVIEGFRTGDAPVFLISLKAGGVGLTLTEADYVYVLDPWWNPAAEAQAVDRAHRIGQRSTVMVYRLVSTDTIEEKVMALKDRKAALFADVVDGGGAAGGLITADDVRALFD
ncbi:DEAD/DEAH box helicase [Nocardioides sp. CFH 31398]|uniref:DEAD/DEAH box helicase n=1 Tax=Nocardioides sp. CFH 31398 TaxID=2919579 RepID=UPI001F06C9F4|nr:DEAD/DEAH box helicase [Nocardioides sp. CFH 31398]MCH1868850.1 DEAD/DEAH box helicase [Nocardioides sp. CFH 31398]